jgi:hypothetical protein
VAVDHREHQALADAVAAGQRPQAFVASTARAVWVNASPMTRCA